MSTRLSSTKPSRATTTTAAAKQFRLLLLPPPVTVEEHDPCLDLLRHDGPIEVGQLAAQGPELIVLLVLRPLVFLDPAYQLLVVFDDGWDLLVEVAEAAVVRLADVAAVGDGPDAVAVDDQQARVSLEGETSPPDSERQSSWTLVARCDGSNGSLAR
jgi:hypothetical protein